MRHWLASFALLIGACSQEAPSDALDVGEMDGKNDRGGVTELPSVSLDVRRADLAIDLATLRGKAVLTVANPLSRTLRLEAQGLEVSSVRSGRRALTHRQEDGALIIETPASTRTARITVEYGFARQHANDGLLAGGSTVLWPHFCGNVYPCVSSPRDGLEFSLALSGVPEGETAIFPEEIATDAPPYMLAWATGDYECEPLGETADGTSLRTCWLPGGRNDALRGTGYLVEAFEYFERTLGPYVFGTDVAAVEVAWGESAAGGMEHHPYWHVDSSSMGDADTQVHEAAHGWFGNGVRIACWEDFVLSEGTATFLSAHALGEVAGDAFEEEIWRGYEQQLRISVAEDDIAAWPNTCGEVDLLRDGLFSNVVYMAGAFFYKAVAAEVGEDELLRVLGGFYRAHVGEAARMQDLLNYLEQETGFDANALADKWLRTRTPGE